MSLVAGTLIVRGIPHVEAAQTVRDGTLVVPLEMSGDRTAEPRIHMAFWSGGTPCDHRGAPLVQVVQSACRLDMGVGFPITHRLCSKPAGREFLDYHELVTTYVALITSHALRVDPGVTARVRREVVTVEDAESPFRYSDTASARIGTGALNRRFPASVGIIGLGGTGSYVLDLVAKTPVRTIHLFDDDAFLQHNAFRAPGAASVEELEAKRAKVDHFAATYSRMHTGIVPHRTKLGPENLDLLDAAGFVFICIDDGAAKGPIISRLERTGKSFVDVGLGLEMGPRGLFGTARITTSTPGMRDHVHEKARIPLGVDAQADVYATNIQVADLNALNAALAVLRWKRLIGFYADGGQEHHATYDVDGNHMNNVDRLGRP